MPTTQENIEHDLLTVEEFAQIVRVDDVTVRRWITRGALEAVKLPHSNRRNFYRIKRATLDKLLNG